MSSARFYTVQKPCYRTVMTQQPYTVQVPVTRAVWKDVTYTVRAAP